MLLDKNMKRKTGMETCISLAFMCRNVSEALLLLFFISLVLIVQS